MVEITGRNKSYKTVTFLYNWKVTLTIEEHIVLHKFPLHFSCPVIHAFRQYDKMCSIHSAMERNYIFSLELLCSQRRQDTFTLQGNQFFGNNVFRLPYSTVMGPFILRN